jgi:hypothetical protein
MKNRIIKILPLIVSLLTLNSLLSMAEGNDTVSAICAKHFKDQFVSDGQNYQALLFNNAETAEFSSTLLGGTIYRIAACSGLTDGNLCFWIYDTKRNLLFTNKDFKNAPYWDFLVNNTVDCIIEAKLDAKNTGSGRAVILIGFKQPE